MWVYEPVSDLCPDADHRSDSRYDHSGEEVIIDQEKS